MCHNAVVQCQLAPGVSIAGHTGKTGRKSHEHAGGLSTKNAAQLGLTRSQYNLLLDKSSNETKTIKHAVPPSGRTESQVSL